MAKDAETVLSQQQSIDNKAKYLIYLKDRAPLITT